MVSIRKSSKLGSNGTVSLVILFVFAFFERVIGKSRLNMIDESTELTDTMHGNRYWHPGANGEPHFHIITPEARVLERHYTPGIARIQFEPIE
jgi:hypothetical protein